MEIDEIKDPKLKELVSAGLKSDCTITNDLEDALSESKDDEELILNWKNWLLRLYELTQYFYRELGAIEAQLPAKPGPSLLPFQKRGIEALHTEVPGTIETHTGLGKEGQTAGGN
jgi:hypothetical protein